jgi:antitoxin component of MazEF toxin-antitoxin module
MTTVLPLKLARIGNSRGIRIPAGVIRRLGLDRAGVVAEVRPDGLFLKAARSAKLSWSETARAMAAAGEDWRDLEKTSADGLHKVDRLS